MPIARPRLTQELHSLPTPCQECLLSSQIVIMHIATVLFFILFVDQRVLYASMTTNKLSTVCAARTDLDALKLKIPHH